MNYYTMSNKELSQLIKKTLKENGYTSKDVSVRVRAALYDTSVNITVKNPFVRLSEVEAVAKRFSGVEYDKNTMEILAGCNVYVHCQYDYGIFEDVAAPFVPAAKKVFNNEKWDGRKIAENENVEIHIIKINDCESRLYEFDKNIRQRNSVDNYIVRCAEGLAEAMWRFKNIGTIYA